MTRKQAATCTFFGHAILLIPAAAFFFGGDAGAQGAFSTCETIGVTGEGFPAYTCPDGSTFYVDLDGDGMNPDSIGRQIETNPAWILPAD